MKRYEFQALVTLGSAPDGGLAARHGGQMRRVVVRARHHLGRGVVTRRLFV